MRVCNYLLLCLFIVSFVTIVVCTQSTVKHLEIDRMETKSSPFIYRYMLNIYEQYRDDDANSEEIKPTVRSFTAMIGKLESREILIYNLSSLPASEEVLKAELHVHLHRRNSKPQIYSLQLWNLMVTSFPLLEEINTNEDDVGWITFKTTKAVLECIHSNPQKKCLLGVSMEGDNGSGILGPLSVKEMHGSDAHPFLITFSERLDGNDTTDYIDERFVIKDLTSDRNKRSVPEYDETILHSKSLSKVDEPTGTRLLKHPLFSKSRGQSRTRRNKRNYKLHNIQIRENVNTDEFNASDKIERVVSFKDLGWGSFIVAPQRG